MTAVKALQKPACYHPAIMTNPTASSEYLFDGRELPCELKRPAFIARCIELPVGESFVFINGHDPAPLRGHLDQLHPACFRWELIKSVEPDAIRLRVTKIATPVGGFAAEATRFSCA